MPDQLCPGEEEGRDQQLDEDVHDGDGAGDGGGEKGGSSTSFSKEVPPIWRLHQSGFRRVIIWANYLSLPIGEVGESEGPTLYVPRPSKLKKKEIILAGGAGGDGGVGIGRRGDELELWRIQYYFYQSHCFFLVHLKVEVKTSLLPLSLFVVVILSS